MRAEIPRSSSALFNNSSPARVSVTVRLSLSNNLTPKSLSSEAIREEMAVCVVCSFSDAALKLRSLGDPHECLDKAEIHRLEYTQPPTFGRTESSRYSVLPREGENTMSVAAMIIVVAAVVIWRLQDLLRRKHGGL